MMGQGTSKVSAYTFLSPVCKSLVPFHGLRTDTLNTVLRQDVLGDRRRTFEERISTSTGFWEGDHISDRLGFAKNGHQPIKP